MLKNKFKKALFGGFLSIAVISSSTIANAETKLTAGIPMPADSIWGEMFSKYIDAVKDVSGGELDIRIVGPESIPANEQIQALRSGMIDILSTYPGAYRS
jgi:TRAP-type C4-dicarboxylate transport system substrate-binding protein